MSSHFKSTIESSQNLTSKRKTSTQEDGLSEKFIYSECRVMQNISLPAKKKKMNKESEGKKQIYVFQMVMKNRERNSLFDQEEYIFRPIQAKRIYFVAGDVLIEPRPPIESDDSIQSGKIFNYFRNIISVEKGSVALHFKMESIKPLKHLDEVIHCLEHSQDINNYEYAQLLKTYQKTVFLIQDLISEVIEQYSQNQEDLLILLKEREKFLLNEKKQLMKELALKGQFAGVGAISLSFQNKATQMSEISLTKHSIAMLGADLDSAAQYFLRKGFMNFFDHASRRIFFRATMEQQHSIFQNIHFTIPAFEILTTDGIKVICECEITNKHVIFPEHLRFQGSKMEKLNNVEQLLFLHFKINQDHINSVLSIRNQTHKNQEKHSECFEYEMDTSIFIEKYYPDIFNKIFRNLIKFSQKLQCGYKIIS